MAGHQPKFTARINPPTTGSGVKKRASAACCPALEQAARIAENRGHELRVSAQGSGEKLFRDRDAVAAAHCWFAAAEIRKLRDAFDGDSVPAKNIALRKAHDLLTAQPCRCGELHEAAASAADLLDQYASFIRSVAASDIEQHPYLPDVENAVASLRAAIAKAEGN